jgi:hypothetical protein
MSRNTSTAQKIKTLLIEISPLIDEYTALTCPQCRDVAASSGAAF